MWHKFDCIFSIITQALESSTASHFFILFRDTLGLKFKGLYCLIAEESKVSYTRLIFVLNAEHIRLDCEDIWNGP